MPVAGHVSADATTLHPSRSLHEVGLVCRDRRKQPGDLTRVVFVVPGHDHRNVKSAVTKIGETSCQCSTDTASPRMAQNTNALLLDDRGGAVTATIVDHHDMLDTFGPQSIHHSLDLDVLVEHRHQDREDHRLRVAVPGPSVEGAASASALAQEISSKRVGGTRPVSVGF
jgi:hypothetical protein